MLFIKIHRYQPALFGRFNNETGEYQNNDPSGTATMDAEKVSELEVEFTRKIFRQVAFIIIQTIIIY